MKFWKDEVLEKELEIYNPELVVVTDSYGVGHYVVLMDGPVDRCAAVVEDRPHTEWIWFDLQDVDYENLEQELRTVLGL